MNYYKNVKIQSAEVIYYRTTPMPAVFVTALLQFDLGGCSLRYWSLKGDYKLQFRGRDSDLVIFQ